MGFLVASSITEESIYCSLSEKVVNEILQKTDSKLPISYSGGGGQYLSQINKLIFYYTSQTPFTVESARKNYLEATSIILETINRDKKIRPYLCEYPFTIDNIRLSISYWPKSNKPEGISSHVMYSNKNIIYQTKNWENGEVIFRLTENFEEVYN